MPPQAMMTPLPSTKKNIFFGLVTPALKRQRRDSMFNNKFIASDPEPA